MGYVTGTSALAGAVGGPPSIIRRTGDATPISANGTLANDDALLWSIGASDVWYFIARILFTAADSSGAAQTADVKAGWSGPTGFTMTWGIDGNANGSLPGYGASSTTGVPLAIKTAADTLSFGGSAVTFGLGLTGVVSGDGSHAGSVNFQWAQNTSNAATLKTAANSFILAWRIA